MVQWLVRRSSSLWSSITKLPQKIRKRSMLSTMISSGIFLGETFVANPVSTLLFRGTNMLPENSMVKTNDISWENVPFFGSTFLHFSPHQGTQFQAPLSGQALCFLHMAPYGVADRRWRQRIRSHNRFSVIFQTCSNPPKNIGKGVILSLGFMFLGFVCFFRVFCAFFWCFISELFSATWSRSFASPDHRFHVASDLRISSKPSPWTWYSSQGNDIRASFYTWYKQAEWLWCIHCSMFARNRK